MERSEWIMDFDDSTMADSDARHGDMDEGVEQEVEEGEEALECEDVIRDPCYPPDGFVPPSQRSPVPPLAGILNRKLEETDPRRFFPEYKQDAILRFSRVFAANAKPSNNNQIWWTSRTFNKHGRAANAAQKNAGEESPNGDGWALRLGPPPRAEDCVEDENDLLCRPGSSSANAAVEGVDKRAAGSDDEEEAPWRYGPAQIWYDRLGLGKNPANFNYGFEQGKKDDAKTSNSVEGGTGRVARQLLPVELENWEEDIILDDEKAREKVAVEFAQMKYPKCGWIPTQQTRNYQSFVTAWNNGSFQAMFSSNTGASSSQQSSQPSVNVESGDPTLGLIDATHSMFPPDNHDLENYRWEDDIIFDPKQVSRIPKPRILTLEFEDDPKAFGVPEDRAEDAHSAVNGHGTKQAKSQFARKSNLILNQIHSRQQQEAEEQLETNKAQSEDKDPFNLSNDDYYFPQNVTRNPRSTSVALQHSIPAQNLHRLFFPTDIDRPNSAKLRNFHRPPIKRKNFRPFIGRWETAFSLARHIRLAGERRDKERASEVESDVFQMREVQDLGGRDGTILLLEYFEQNPPLLSQTGMASKLRNYYKRKVDEAGKDEPEFGEATYIHSSSPFLGGLANDQCLQAIENNMFRAPLFRHTQTRAGDFLLIRTKFGLFIRQLPALFLVGQEHPLMQVPSPSSKQAAAFSRDFLLAYIYRLFWESDDSPRRVKFQEIRRAFSHLTENAIKKRLKGCADMRKIGAGAEQVYWVLRDDFRLPSKEEVHSMITPEMCCAYWSMLSAEQRLRDAGYGDKYIFAVENEDSADEESTEKESEVKCAPWNTTRAYLAASKSRCLFDQTGIADPSGCGLGFSFVRVALRPPKEKETFQIPKRLVTGTNADLRKLPLKEAREMCRGWGLSEEEMNSLSRWELVDVIRTLSTQAAKAGSDFSGVGRFARGNLRLDVSDAQEKHKAFCQQRFELQNRVLETAEESASENEDLDDDVDAHEHGGSSHLRPGLHSTVSTLAGGLKDNIVFDLEQLRRLDVNLSVGGGTRRGEHFVSRAARETALKSNEAKTSQPQTGSDTARRKLKIHRLIKSADGTESVVEEVVAHPQLVEAYLRIRATKDEAFIKVYSHDDEHFKEEKRRETKRRQMEDKVRIKKKAEDKPPKEKAPKEKVPKEVKESPPKPRKEPKPPKPPPPIKESLLRMKCSSCGAFGHMKTNRHCPLYGKEVVPHVKTVGEICERHDEVPEMAEMVAIEGMRKHVEKLKKNALRLHIPRHVLDKRAKQAKVKGLKSESRKTAPQRNSDANQPSTSSIATTSDDGTKAVPSSKLKGGLTLSISIPTVAAIPSTAAMQPPPPQMSAGSAGLLTPGGSSTASGLVARRRGTLEEADYLIGPHKSVHRRRADPRISMASQLHDIFNEFKSVENVDLLALPNNKKVPDYYEIIRSPIDLQLVRNNISTNKYELRRQFLEDLKQVYVNSCVYNGAGHLISKAAKEVLDLATKKLTEREKKLISLEKAINPLLDDDDMVGFSHILLTVVQACKNLPKSGPFHDKVDSKKHPFYYQRIERPMDLGTMERNIKKHGYTTVTAFRRDIEQICENSLTYNGAGNFYTTKAQEIMNLADRLLHENDESLAELESNIQRAMQGGDEGMSMASSDVGGGLLELDPISAALFSAGGGEEGEIEERYKMGEVSDEPGAGTSAEAANENPLLPDTLNLASEMTSPIALGEAIPEDSGEAMAETGQEVGVLHEDLALSDEDDEEEAEQGGGGKDGEDAGSGRQYSPLERSQMHSSGQLNADLALSNSEEDEEEQIEMAKRPRLDQDDFDASL